MYAHCQVKRKEYLDIQIKITLCISIIFLQQEFNSKKVREELALRHQRLSRTPPTSPRNKFDTRWLNGELSSDHAGETGAVWIYEGALDAMKVNSVSAEVARGFVLEHLQVRSWRK